MPTPTNDRSLNRRDFFKTGLVATGGLAASPHLFAKTESRKAAAPENTNVEWRNRQPDMAYRKLGRTGFMISEMVIGGSGPINDPEHMHVFEAAIERGVNYLDSAARYGKNGASERGWGKLVSQPGYRDKVFLSTKLSPYVNYLDDLTQEIFQGLPGEKQEALREQARELVQQRQITKPGYFYPFFRNHGSDIEPAYLNYFTRREYGFQKKWKGILEKKLRETLETSLERLNTDVIDVLHFPHGIRMPEELEDEFHRELAEKLKKEGKIRANSFSCHTDQARILSRAAELGHIDVAMCAYNIANQGSVEPAIEKAVQSGMGVIAMKAAAIISPIVESFEVPEWRIQKLHQAIPEEMPLPVKAYLWVLQNPNLSAVISEIQSREMIVENLQVAGKRVEIQPV